MATEKKDLLTRLAPSFECLNKAVRVRQGPSRLRASSHTMPNSSLAKQFLSAANNQLATEARCDTRANFPQPQRRQQEQRQRQLDSSPLTALAALSKQAGHHYSATPFADSSSQHALREASVGEEKSKRPVVAQRSKMCLWLVLGAAMLVGPIR